VVGEYGWPQVAVYIGEPPEVFGEEAKRYEDPSLLWGLPLEEIARLRSYVTLALGAPRRRGNSGSSHTWPCRRDP